MTYRSMDPTEVHSGYCYRSGDYVRDAETLDAQGNCGRCEACLEAEAEEAEEEGATPSFFSVAVEVCL